MRNASRLDFPTTFGVVRGSSLGHNEPTPKVSSQEPVIEEQIILLIGCGKPRERDAGVRALYELMGSPMLRFFVHLGVPGQEARDLLQETFVKILRAAPKFNPGGSAKAWLWQIARNCLNDHLRETARLRKHETMFDDEQWNTVKDTVPAKASSVCSVDECVAQGIARFSAAMAGALIAALIIAAVEVIGSYTLGTSWKEVLYLLLFIAILVVRPAGLFGQRGSETLGV